MGIALGPVVGALEHWRSWRTALPAVTHIKHDALESTEAVSGARVL